MKGCQTSHQLSDASTQDRWCQICGLTQHDSAATLIWSINIYDGRAIDGHGHVGSVPRLFMKSNV